MGHGRLVLIYCSAKNLVFPIGELEPTKEVTRIGSPMLYPKFSIRRTTYQPSITKEII
jgi:hypothetical protein